MSEERYKWELVNGDHDGGPYEHSNRTHRLSVPGGWLYREVNYPGDFQDPIPIMAIAFVPDPSKDTDSEQS